MGAAPCRHRVHWERAQSLVGCAARFQSAESMSTETRRRDGEAAGDRRKGRGGNPPMAESGSPWQTHRTFLKYRAKQKRTALIRHCRWHKIPPTDNWVFPKCPRQLRSRAPGEPPKGESSTLSRRSEEPTSELQSLMRIPYAVFCLNKQT